MRIFARPASATASMPCRRPCPTIALPVLWLAITRRRTFSAADAREPSPPAHVLPLCCHRLAGPALDFAELPDRSMRWSPLPVRGSGGIESWEARWICMRRMPRRVEASRSPASWRRSLVPLLRPSGGLAGRSSHESEWLGMLWPCCRRLLACTLPRCARAECCLPRARPPAPATYGAD